MSAIVVQDFHKAYDTTVAVVGLSFEVEPGTILGLVGPNGAGKTTTMRALAGILAPTRGKLSICGHDLETEPGEPATDHHDRRSQLVGQRASVGAQSWSRRGAADARYSFASWILKKVGDDRPADHAGKQCNQCLSQQEITPPPSSHQSHSGSYRPVGRRRVRRALRQDASLSGPFPRRRRWSSWRWRRVRQN